FEYLKEALAVLVSVVVDGRRLPEVLAVALVVFLAAAFLAGRAVPDDGVAFEFDVEISAAAVRALGGELSLARRDVGDAVLREYLLRGHHVTTSRIERLRLRASHFASWRASANDPKSHPCEPASASQPSPSRSRTITMAIRRSGKADDGGHGVAPALRRRAAVMGMPSACGGAVRRCACAMPAEGVGAIAPKLLSAWPAANGPPLESRRALRRGSALFA